MAKKKRSEASTHHILWQKNHWNVGYSKLLRDHPYMKKVIPTETLHDDIHRVIADIPAPAGYLCKRAYIRVCELYENGDISDTDTIERRIDVLMSCWSVDECPLTILMLTWQKDIVSKYYNAWITKLP